MSVREQGGLAGDVRNLFHRIGDRLFFYEWGEGVFAENADTVEGAAQHRRVDGKPTALPGPRRGGHHDRDAGAEGRPGPSAN